MSALTLIEAMLAGRRTLELANPQLLAASSRRWDLWLQSQRFDRADLSRRQIVVVAEITCIEDVPLHVGLMHLLSLQDWRCEVVLSLPTDEMARIVRAQARRAGWHTLVRIVDTTACRQMLLRLQQTTPLAVFAVPRPLAAASNLGSLVAGADTAPGIFLGLARDFVGWVRTDREDPSDAFEDALSLLVRQDAESLLGTLENAGTDGNKVIGEAVAVTVTDGQVKLPDPASADEILVIRENEVIARRSGLLPEPDAAWRIRVPGDLVTASPQTICMETRKADGGATAAKLQLQIPASKLQSWMLAAFLNRGGAGNQVIRAFAESVGCRIAFAEDESAKLSDVPVVWGVLRGSDRILAQAKAQGLYYFYIDHAYFHRGHGRTYRIARNAYEAGPVRKCPSDRLENLGLEVAPWNDAGREIIVCPPTDHFMLAHGCPDWLESTLTSLRSVTDRPLVVRTKPQPGDAAVPIPEALRTAHALVTHSSNVAIEAACLGTPVFVSPTSAAAPIGRTDLAEIENPVRPDRAPWLAHLAYNQFSLDEIRDGSAWRMLLDLEERELV